jgi:hypothetical protein
MVAHDEEGKESNEKGKSKGTKRSLASQKIGSPMVRGLEAIFEKTTNRRGNVLNKEFRSRILRSMKIDECLWNEFMTFARAEG